MTEMVLFKNDPLLIATLFALALDPMPYTLIDKVDRIQILFREDIGAVRMFRMGAMASDMVKVVKGFTRDQRQRRGF